MRSGLLLSEVRRLSVADMVAFADVAAEPERPEGPRKATQADIDALLG